MCRPARRLRLSDPALAMALMHGGILSLSKSGETIPDTVPEPVDAMQPKASAGRTRHRHSTGMPWGQAYAVARDTPRPLPVDRVPVGDAIGRILAAPIHAVTPAPAFDAAAMDGFAVAGPGPWRITGRILAGSSGVREPLAAGTAVEIATGAMVPAGADAVVPYEDCRATSSTVSATPGTRTHIRRVGDDVRIGDLIVPAGRPVTATVAAAAVQAGADLVSAIRSPTVTLLVTGDEVITTGTPRMGQVRDTFTGLIQAITIRAGAELRVSRHLRDDPVLLRTALDEAITDVVVVTGSSSAGAADHLHSVLDLGEAVWHVRGVACRPGHPQALAALPDGRWVISLPGNPYAGLVAALTVLEPVLRALAGQPPAVPCQIPVSGAVTLMPHGVRIAPVRCLEHGAEIVPGTGSAGLHSAAGADAVAVLPADWVSGRPAITLPLP